MMTRTCTTSEATARMSNNSCPLTILTGRLILSIRWMTKPTSDQEHLIFSCIYSFFVYTTISKRLFWQLAIYSCRLLSRSRATTPPTYSVGWQVVVSCFVFIFRLKEETYFSWGVLKCTETDCQFPISIC